MITIEDNFRHKGLRKQLVDSLRNSGNYDEDVLEAIGKVPRHAFLDSGLVEMAYQDIAFPIGSKQTISQPSTVAKQTQLLQVTKGLKVLEIGTGSGYQACVLAAIGAKVFSIERQRNLYFQTKELLEKMPFRVKTFLGDGYEGLPTFQPFDRILITAAAPIIPPKLIEQLKVGGIMVIPLDGETGEKQTMLRLIKQTDGSIKQEEFGDCRFVPMLEGTGKD